jgi:hypothetical protein
MTPPAVGPAAADFACQSAAQLNAFVADFIAGTLPKVSWTHRAHLVVGLWHVANYSPTEAGNRLRERIRAYNVAVGGANTDSQGYHETITQFYVASLARWLAEQPDSATELPTVARRLLQSRLADRDYPLEFYSRERLFSGTARREYQPPDLERRDYLSSST